MAVAIKKEKTKFAPVKEVLSEKDHANYIKIHILFMVAPMLRLLLRKSHQIKIR